MMNKNAIGTLFDKIARRYEVFNHISSFGMDIWWRRRAIGVIGHHERLLDVAAGTGSLSFEALTQKKANRVVGLDISEEMVRIGREKAMAKGLMGQMEWVLANSSAIPFNEGSFDAVICGFGVRNFAQLEIGLREMYRILEDGGELMILEFSYPTNRLFALLYDFYFRRIMIPLGGLLTGNRTAFSYFYESVRNFMPSECFCHQLQQVGFTNIRCLRLSFGICTIYHAQKPLSS